MRKSGMGSHESAVMQNDEWLTPRYITANLGKFDLDPCSPINRPWDTADKHFNINDNGLILPWAGRVWLNPPYGSQMAHWLKKMAEHCNGIALTFARTDTKAFQKYVFEYADSILFLSSRIKFLTVLGKEAKEPAGAPSVLISYGEYNADMLSQSGIQGRHVPINATPLITVAYSPDWKSVISISLINLNRSAPLKDIYEMVERIAPDKVAKNKHFEAKIRQKLQQYFKPVQRGVWTLFEN